MEVICLSMNGGSSHWLSCLIVLCLLSFSGTCINSFVLFIFLRMKSVFKHANKFLITLIVGQIMMTLFVAPFRIFQIATTKNQTDCRMESLKEYVSSLVLVSGVANGVISYDRYLHVALAHNYRIKMKGFVMYLLLSLPWISTLVCLLSIVIGELVNYAVLIVITILLGVTLVVNYTRLIKVLKVQHRNISVGKQSRNLRKRKDSKAILLCICVILVEFTCSAPGLITLVCGFAYYATGSTWRFWQANNAVAKEVALIFFLFSACVNPVVYLYSHREFKHYLRKVLRINASNRVGEESGNNQAMADFTHEQRLRRISDEMRRDEGTGTPRVARKKKKSTGDSTRTVSLFMEGGEFKEFPPASAIGNK